MCIYDILYLDLKYTVHRAVATKIEWAIILCVYIHLCIIQPNIFKSLKITQLRKK